MIRLLLCTSLVLLYILCACTTALAAGSGTFSDTVLISLVSRLHWPQIFSACTHTLMLPPPPTPTHFAAVSNNYVTVTSYHSFGFEIPQWDLFRRHSSILLKNASRCWWHCDLHRSVCCKLSSLSAVTKIICLIQKCSQKADKSRMIQFLHKKKSRSPNSRHYCTKHIHWNALWLVQKHLSNVYSSMFQYNNPLTVTAFNGLLRFTPTGQKSVLYPGVRFQALSHSAANDLYITAVSH